MSRPEIDVAVRGLTLGEGPHWVEERSELVYVDMFGHAVHRLDWATGQDFKLNLDANTSMIIPIESEGRFNSNYVIASGSTIRRLDWDGNSREEAVAVESLPEIASVNAYPGSRFNDGKCDSKGRLWTGTQGPGPSMTEIVQEQEHLYKLDLDGKMTSHVDKVTASNGLAWTTDSSTLFYVDSFASTVQAFDFNLEDGTLGNQRVLTDFRKLDHSGFPDGMTLDNKGNLWVAFYGGAVFNVDSTTGQVIETLDFGSRAKSITSLTFGGPNLDTLFVTSGNWDVTTPELQAGQPDAGCLFKVTNLGVKGVSGGLPFKGPLAKVKDN